jgi:2-polyprenyl-3-methyl-5-hydroxy-6-metoxy-1,4-benzoquinol methylase
MAEDSGQTVVAALFDSILPLAPGLTERLARGIDVLDVGCGRGRALLELARAYPTSRFTGYDLGEEAIAWARSQAQAQGLGNIFFEIRDAVDIEEREQYDLITAFDAIHDQARPDLVLANIRAALRPAGLFLMQDIRASSHLERNLDHPAGTLFYAVSVTHCMSVSLAAGGMGLGTMWGEEQALAMLADAGFGRVRVEQLPHDFQNNFYLARPE